MADSCLADLGLFGRSFAPLYERFRPSAWADVVGQEKVVKRILAMRQRGGAKHDEAGDQDQQESREPACSEFGDGPKVGRVWGDEPDRSRKPVL